MNRRVLGSMTARGGFVNEAIICQKFLNWHNDQQAQEWLEIMGYDCSKIKALKAINIPPRISRAMALELGISPDKYIETIKYKKSDIQIRLEILIANVLFVENLSLKKANRDAGFNQVDKRPVDTYREMWNFSDNITTWLKLFTGEINPKYYLDEKVYMRLSDKRRVFINEMPENIRRELISFFKENKVKVACDILKGRGGLSADWMLVTENSANKIRWILRDINHIINHYSYGDVYVTERGSLMIGRIFMQRKGGTPDPTSLQFKINPLSLFNET